MVRERARVGIYSMLTRTDNWECCTNNIANFPFTPQGRVRRTSRNPSNCVLFPIFYLHHIAFLIRTCWDEYKSCDWNSANFEFDLEFSNSIWNFRIRASLRSGVSTKSFFLFFVYFREITAFQELTRMLSMHKSAQDNEEADKMQAKFQTKHW